MKVAAYARVSTFDKEQNPETQMLAIERYCEAKGWEITIRHVDHASARDVLRRKAWRDLIANAGRRPRQFDAILVFKLDRAFRSPKHMYDTLTALDEANVGFRSVMEDFDTTTAHGRLVIGVLASVAGFERDTNSDRVKAGMARRRKEGMHLGRPAVTTTRGFQNRFASILPGVLDGTKSIGKAARELDISHRTMKRLMEAYAAKEAAE